MKNRQMKTIGLVLASLMATVLLISPAWALEAKLSGQINQMVMYADDGKDSDFFVTDNNNSSTRIRATGEEAVSDSVKVGFQFEMEALENSSNRISISNSDAAGTNKTLEWNSRWLNIYFDTQFGKFEIGKGDAAANGITELDLSGTSVAAFSSIASTSSAFALRYDDGSSGSTIGQVFSNFDGALSRTERIRYNTPSFAGLTFAAAAANAGAWDASLMYSAEIYGKIVAGLGYTNMQRNADYTQIAGSVSWLAPFGLNVTFAYGSQDYNDSAYADPTNYYVKVGYITGIHAFSIEYDNCADYNLRDRTGTMYGAAYVIKPWKPVELYAAYRLYSVDNPSSSTDPKDFSQFYAGTRIKF